MNLAESFPNLFSVNAMKDEQVRISPDASQETRLDYLQAAIEAARPVTRLCNKLKTKTDGRMMPVLLHTPEDYTRIGELKVFAGTEGPELLSFSDSFEQHLRGMVMAIESAKGVGFQQKEVRAVAQ